MSYSPPAIIQAQIDLAVGPALEDLIEKGEQIEALITDVSEQSGDLRSVQDSITDKEAKIAALQVQVNAKASTEDAQKNAGDIAGLRDLITTMQAHIMNLEADVAQLKQGMAKMDSKNV